MPDSVNELLSQYIAEHRAGGTADPLEFLARADETDRPELTELLDAYLARSLGREWDAEAFKGSTAERVAADFARSLQGSAGWWPAILPRLRNQARLTRAQVVERLSTALGVAGREEKVGGYYHGMEHGSLDSRRVSERVLGALGEIYGTTAEKLRELGEPIGQGSAAAGAPAQAMARTAVPDPAYGGEMKSSAADQLSMPAPGEPARPDEIDEMFTGGP